mmetsp:Transcript_6865/g.16162  ORF Transcript_6865/g.16162 Transcript_6865/m.16162 type:complete len:234 (+) Transcript_6865:298-999(+)
MIVPWSMMSTASSLKIACRSRIPSATRSISRSRSSTLSSASIKSASWDWLKPVSSKSSGSFSGRYFVCASISFSFSKNFFWSLRKVTESVCICVASELCTFLRIARSWGSVLSSPSMTLLILVSQRLNRPDISSVRLEIASLRRFSLSSSNPTRFDFPIVLDNSSFLVRIMSNNVTVLSTVRTHGGASAIIHPISISPDPSSNFCFAIRLPCLLVSGIPSNTAGRSVPLKLSR